MEGTSTPPPPLRVLWVATKPPWPPRDGGRLLQWLTLEALAGLPGAVEVDLVAPLVGADAAATARALAAVCRPHLVAARPWPLPLAWLAARAGRVPLTVARHRLPAVRRRVHDVAAERSPVVVHAEQAQAMPQALAAGLPVVLRAQNVESDLWAQAGAPGGGLASLARGALRREGARLARWEGEVVRSAARTVAVTAEDAGRLARLAGNRDEAEIEALPVPFPAQLPAGPPLPGDPAVVLLAGAGWRPNREGAEAFLATTWPAFLRLRPGALLHLFGEVAADGVPSVVPHATPSDPAAAFPAGALMAVPLAVASGIRMKILEAWARGLPVVATPAAAAGLAATAGEHLGVAPLGQAFATALGAVAGDASAQGRQVAAARALLVARHSPPVAAAALLDRWRAVAGVAHPRR
jgi:hypothetical protein